MNFEQIEYSIKVAQTKSITTASAELSVTPSTISQAITRLEEELGIKLFQRTRKGAYPLEEASHIFDKFNEVMNTIQSIKESIELIGNGELKLAVIPGGVPSMIQTISSMKKNNSEIRFELSEKTSMKIIQDIKDKNADLGLIAIYEENVNKYLSGLSFQSISSGKFFAFMSRSNPLSKFKSLRLSDMINETFVLFNDEFVDFFLEELTQSCERVDVLLRTNNSEVISASLTQLNAVTFGHEYSLTNMRMQEENFVKVELEIAQRDILIGWVMDTVKASNPIIKRFIERHQFESRSIYHG
ncbi:LysR family transcriptional regulator [Neobacillus mesonae]|nr:LysR family transcriptional regulator [Neobacillus mesonae]